MHVTLESKFHSEIMEAKRLMSSGSLEEAFTHLERAHVLGQRYVVPHVQAHWLMLKIGLSRRSITEVFGQAVRILLGALGSVIGVVPTGKQAEPTSACSSVCRSIQNLRNCSVKSKHLTSRSSGRP